MSPLQGHTEKKLQHSCGENKKACGGLSDTEVKKHCGQVPKARARTHTHTHANATKSKTINNKHIRIFTFNLTTTNRSIYFVYKGTPKHYALHGFSEGEKDL